jgi:integrase
MIKKRGIAAMQPNTRLRAAKNLYLQRSHGDSRAWVFRYEEGGKEHVLGLGPYPDVSIEEAEQKALAMRKRRIDGLAPRADVEDSKTFKQTMEAYFADHERKWTAPRHAAAWKRTLDVYAKPLHGLRVDHIDTQAVLRALRPHWDSKPQTIKTVANRIAAVCDYALAHGWRSEDNPASWERLGKVLVAPANGAPKHHKAMKADALPAFYAGLPDRQSAAALRFLILTAARREEVVNALWFEVDLDAATWTVPAARMKGRKQDHCVPLSGGSVALLKALLRVADDPRVFAGLGVNAMLRLMPEGVTLHGFRSSFRDWVDDKPYSYEAKELALSHVVGSGTERTYRRDIKLDERRRMMQQWADFVTGSEPAKVVPLRRS